MIQILNRRKLSHHNITDTNTKLNQHDLGIGIMAGVGDILFPYFGNIENGIMKLSPIGIIANILWYEINNHFENIQLGEFITLKIIL